MAGKKKRQDSSLTLSIRIYYGEELGFHVEVVKIETTWLRAMVVLQKAEIRSAVGQNKAEIIGEAMRREG